MGRRAPRPLSAALETALGDAAPKTLLSSVQTVWARAVGADIAAQAEPVSERSGVVTVACASAAWAEQLELMQTDLLARLEAEIGENRGEMNPLRLRFTALGGA